MNRSNLHNEGDPASYCDSYHNKDNRSWSQLAVRSVLAEENEQPCMHA